MSDRLEWYLDLQDKISMPASRIDRELRRVRASLRSLDIEARQTKLAAITDPLKRQRADFQLQRDKLMLSKAAMEKSGHVIFDLSGRLQKFRQGLRDTLIILDVLARGFGFVAGRALDFGKTIAKAVSFRESALIGLETTLGGGAGGVFEKLAALAGRIGKPIEQVVTLGRTLANVGVKESDIEPMVRLIEDLDAMDPGAGEKLAGAIRGIFATGKMGSGDVEALRGTILRPEKIYEEISRRLSGTRNRIAGKAILDTEIGVGKNIGAQTLLQQVLDLEGGRAGAKSGRAGQTLEGRLARVRIQMDRMYSNLANSPAVKTFEKILDNLRKVFDPDTVAGRSTLDRLERLSEAIGKFLEPLTGAEGKQRMIDFFDSLATAIEKVLPGMRLLASFAGRLIGNTAAIAEMTLGEGPPTPDSALSREARDRIGRNLNSNRRMPNGLTINLNQNVDARGATKEDAQHIADVAAQKAKDALSDEIVRIATAAGAFTP